MTKYLLPKARNLETKQTVAQQDLSGYRFQLHQRAACQLMADRLASQLSTRTGAAWIGYCETYTPVKMR